MRRRAARGLAHEHEEDLERDLPEVPPRREAFVIFYATVALTFIHFHGRPRFLPQDAQLFGWFLVNFVVLFCIPALIVHHLWRRPLARYGLQWGQVAIWGRYFAVYLVLMLPIVGFISRTPQFQAFYPICGPARDSFGWFLLSALGWLAYFFAWEFFYRGFMLFSLSPRYGGGVAILIQTLPFVMMHYPKPEAEAWSSIVAGIALGLMAFRGNSFLGCWLLHWLIATLMDLSVILWPVQ